MIKVSKDATRELKRMHNLSKSMTEEERMLWKLARGEELSPKQQEMWKRYNEVWALRMQGFSRHQTVQVLIKNYEINNTQAYATYKQAEYIFGKMQIDKAAERVFIAEKLQQLAQKHEAEKPDFARKCYMDAAKLLQLNKPDEERPPVEMPVINLSDDPGALENTQDAEYTEE